MGVMFNGKEVSKEEFTEIIMQRKKYYDYVKRMSKTELGRGILKQKGIEPLTETNREQPSYFNLVLQ